MTTEAGWELTTVSDDGAVAFGGTDVRRYEGLAPGTDYEFDGLAFRTLPRPVGELLCRVATANDVHFGETECGVVEGMDLGPAYTVGPGEEPYPELMNRCAIAEMTTLDPAAVVVKGDLTSVGAPAEYDRFLNFYRTAFGDRLVHVRGNHDAKPGVSFAAWPVQLVELPGLRLAVLDTSLEGRPSGQLTGEQLAWLDDAAAAAGRDGFPMLVMGHHHPWDPGSTRQPGYFGIDPDSSEGLVAVVARRTAIVGYFAGHTHRNRVRRFEATGEVPYVEVACVKDFPGAWAEYRVYEGGVLQVLHRVADPAALAWTEHTREMFGGLYQHYAFGSSLADRCFPITFRT